MAALTFAITSSFRCLQRYTIPGPITAAIFTPALILIVSPFALGEMFIAVNDPSSRMRYGLVVLLAAVIAVGLSAASAVACSAVFEFVPRRLESLFGVKPELLLQVSILIGGILSLTVNLLFFGWLTNMLWGNLRGDAISASTGLISSAACIRALLGIRHPEVFHPPPTPNSIKGIVLGHERSAGSQ
jgi:small-conductance mechanosensitive channel